MELIITTIGLGIIAKFFEMKLQKHTKFEKEWVPVNEVSIPREEKIAYEVYS